MAHLQRYLYEFVFQRKKSDIPFPRHQYRNSSEVFEAWKTRFYLSYREEFYVLLLNTKNYLVGYSLVSIGSATCALVHPREVFVPVVETNAASVILLHNHPSGDPAPSAEDLNITRRLREIGEVMGVKILDHIIVGETYTSFVDDGYWGAT